MTDEAEIVPGSKRGRGRLARQWVASALLAVVVVAVVETDRVPVDVSHSYRMPRFTVDLGDPGAGPWLQVHAPGKERGQRLVESVQPPSRFTGEPGEIIDGPGGVFLLAAHRTKPCETRLYRFRLTGDGHVTGLARVRGGTVPALTAGLAVSPDGRRIAYATAPCAASQPRSPAPSTSSSSVQRRSPAPASTPRATLAVLDTATGRSRTWMAAGPSIVGEIVWARDGRTVGYTTGRVVDPAAYGDVRDITVHALDTTAPGRDLLAGRVLFRPPSGAGTLVSATMDSDGRSGRGMMQKGEPATTIFFSFTEGRPMRITGIIKPKPPYFGVGVGRSSTSRFACLNGIDAFDRVEQGAFRADRSGFGHCTSAAAY